MKASAAMTEQPTLLIVDDVPDNIRVLANLLRAQARLLVATNGEDALRLAKTQDIDGILLDIIMPEMDGHEVCRRLKNDPATRDIPIMFVTVLTDSGDEEIGIELGAVDFIARPFVPGVVRARVGSMLRLQRVTKQLKSAYDKLHDAYNTIERDLRAASELQRSLLPRSGVVFGELEHAFFYRPSTHLSGDMFNYFSLDDRYQIVYCLDVAGHGVSAALMAATLSNLLRPYLFLENSADAGRNEAERMGLSACNKLNKQFQFDTSQDIYFTCQISVFDKTLSRLSIVQAGHPRPILHTRSTGAIEIGECGVPIGFLEEPDYTATTFDLERGDRLFIFSDGVTECENPSNEPFGVNRLSSFVAEAHHHGVEMIVEDLGKALERWRGSERFDDDVSIVAIERK